MKLKLDNEDYFIDYHGASNTESKYDFVSIQPASKKDFRYVGMVKKSELELAYRQKQGVFTLHNARECNEKNQGSTLAQLTQKMWNG